MIDQPTNQREEFEKWADDHWHLIDDVEHAFEIWQAAIESQQVPEWMPIETAPKDAPILIGPTKRIGICVAKNDSRDGWVTETPSEWCPIYTPTHWMPLPQDPSAKEKT